MTTEAKTKHTPQMRQEIEHLRRVNAELLEACRGFSESTIYSAIHPDLRDQFKSLFSIARRAIQKAEGR